MPNDQRIWIISELYYPELTSTGYFLTGIAEGLTSSHSVSVLCGQPSYWARGVHAPSHEILNGVDVHRCWATTFDKNKVYLKFLNLITVSASIFWAALSVFRRGDIVIAVTNPPLLPYLTAFACRVRGARFVLLIHDVYPEVLIRLGILKPSSMLFQLMELASSRLYKKADRIVVLGRDMEELVAQKVGVCRSRVMIATNWGDTEAVYPTARKENALLHKLNLYGQFVVQYCGNIGRTHGIEDLIGAAELLGDDPDVHLLLIGWGAKKQWATQQREQRKLANLTILDPLLQEDLCDGLNACNVAFISFSSGMAGISVPSRMYNVLASGKPVLAVCDSDSELAAVVREERIGWVIPPGHPNLIVSALREGKADPETLRLMGLRARRAAETKYMRGHVLEKYNSLIKSLRCD